MGPNVINVSHCDDGKLKKKMPKYNVPVIKMSPPPLPHQQESGGGKNVT